MNIGITTIFAHRGTTAHAYYIAKSLEKQEHNVSCMVCDAALPSCYTLLSKNKSKLKECPVCMMGGMRSFPINDYYAINKNQYDNSLSDHALDEMTISSIMTLERAERLQDIDSNRIALINKKLKKSVSIVYENTKRWIKKNDIETVLCYNGRMDVTRAIINACEEIGVKYFTFERPWNGFGIQFNYMSNCLALENKIRINREYKDKPLSKRQAKIAKYLADSRVSQKSRHEWRTYAPSVKSNISISPKIIVFPSSSCEFYGHNDWELSWDHFTLAVDELIEKMGIRNDEVYIKLHPVWEQYIGYKDGAHIKRFYIEWAKSKDYKLIEVDSGIASNDLINSSEFIVTGGSTVGVDAGLQGKKVILLGRAFYEGADFFYQVKNKDDWSVLDKLNKHDYADTIIKTHRFLYNSTFRFPQLSNKVIPNTYFDYSFVEDDMSFLFDTIKNGEITAWDKEISENNRDENEILSGQNEYSYKYILSLVSADGKEEVIKRRIYLRFLDKVRSWFPRGDRIAEDRK